MSLIEHWPLGRFATCDALMRVIVTQLRGVNIPPAELCVQWRLLLARTDYVFQVRDYAVLTRLVHAEHEQHVQGVANAGIRDVWGHVGDWIDPGVVVSPKLRASPSL